MEQKASRLLTPFVALIAGAVAITAFLLAAIDFDRPAQAVIAGLGACFGFAGFGWLVTGLSRALDADTRLSTAIVVKGQTEVADPRTALWHEALAADATSWVVKCKAERILYARSAISRAILAVLFSAAAGAVVLIIAANQDVGVEPAPAPVTPAPPVVTVTVPAPVEPPSSEATPRPTPSPRTGPR